MWRANRAILADYALNFRVSCAASVGGAQPLTAGNVMIHQVLDSIDSAWMRLSQLPSRKVAAAVAALLLGTGATAFAVANLVPDASQVLVQQIVEPVQNLQSQPTESAGQPRSLLSADALADLRLYRSDITRSTDSADTVLRRLGINDPQAADYLRADNAARAGVWGRPGRMLAAEVDARQHLVKLSVRWAPQDDGSFNRLTIERAGTGYSTKLETAPLVASTRLAGGVIRSSLFAATDDARIPDAVAIQIASIFESNIDFNSDLRRGDRFSVVYETLEADGEPIRAGKVLSAEFVNGGKTRQAMWFQETGVAKGGYYGFDGKSMRHAYLASPLEFSRVSSGFKMRFHPILQKWRAHLGVDFAAATGTPVRSVGDGEVSFAGWQNGFGNVVFVRHRNDHETVYAHLSKIMVKKGQKISQSEHVGLVGATGWATGPHLHFEFRIAGQHHDPMTIAQQSESVPINAASRPEFERVAKLLQPKLQAAAGMRLASAQ